MLSDKKCKYGDSMKSIYPDSAGKVKPLERQTNASSHGESGRVERGTRQFVSPECCRRLVMLVANRTAPLLGSKSAAMKSAWAFVKKGSFVTKAVGVTFGNCQNTLRRLEQYPIQDVGYRLRRDPGNPYDPNAVCVDGCLWGQNVGQVGHLPRDLAASVAPLMDAGVAFYVTQHAIYGGVGRGYSLGVKLRVLFSPERPKGVSAERGRAECRPTV